MKNRKFININHKFINFKSNKKFGFRGYFTVFVSVILCVAVVCSIVIEDLANRWIFKNIEIPYFAVVIVFSLVIGTISAWFVAKFALNPIRKIRDAMVDVAGGNLDVAIEEESLFHEIEYINHAFNIMVKELRSTEMLQSDFIAGVSHEFKTPLTAIEGYTTMLQASDLSEEEKEEYVNKILFNTHRMSNLVQNILLLSKLDNQAIEKRVEVFSLDEQIRQEILAAESKWTEKNIDFDVQLEKVSYRGNSTIISHIWSNLIDNAIKFSPQGGKITLELSGNEKNVLFSITDEGEGIKEDQITHIFNKFYQADSSHKQNGNGLGLAIVKSTVSIYGGEVKVENVAKKGCKFTVSLPL